MNARPQTADVRIAAVIVRVEGEEDRPDLLSLAPIAVGDPYLPKKIDDAVKRIYKTGLFSDVEVLAEGDRDVRLTFLLRRKLLARSITFSGEIKMSRKNLLAGLYALRPEAEFSDPRLRRAEDELREIMRRDGFLNAEVRGKASPDASLQLVDVDFEIIPGARFTVRNVDFRGGLTELQADLLKAMATGPGRPYRPSALESDLELIRTRYGTLGYPRAEVSVQNRFFQEADATIGLVLRVVPNERVRITIRGADIPETLVRPLWEERIFEEWGLRQAEAAILTHLRKKGFVFATVHSQTERNADELHIIHDIDPGLKIRIMEVAFEGLKAFSEDDIRKELGLISQLPFFGSVAGDKLFAMPGRLESFYENQGFPGTRATLQFKPWKGGSQALFVVEEGPRQTIRALTIKLSSLIPEDELRRQIESREGGPYNSSRIRRDAERLESYYSNRGIRGTIIAVQSEPLADERFNVVF